MACKVGGDTAKYALDNKLVDELVTHRSGKGADSNSFGWSKADNNYRAISYYDYVKTPSDQVPPSTVILANGAMDGEERPTGNVGGDTTAAQNRDARAPRSRKSGPSFCA